MKHGALIPLVMFSFCATFAVAGWSQAAAEYGLAAGAAAGATKAPSVANDALKQTGDKLQQALSGAGNNTTSGTTAPPTPSTPAPVATKTIETAMKENLEKLQPRAPQEGATVRIDSAPANATLLVDGLIVGYTPKELTLASGQHVVELKQSDSLPWRKEIELKTGETADLKPVLQRKYQSVVTLSGGK